MKAERQFTLFDLGAPDVTPQMRRDLAKLEAAKPFGLPRTGNDFVDFARRRIRQLDVAPLTARDLARIDYSGRTPRLKITRKGREALDNMDQTI